MTDGHGDLDNNAYRAGYQDGRKAVLEEAIESVKYEAQFFDANGKDAANRIVLVLKRLVDEA
jgi:hypothetical protein